MHTIRMVPISAPQAGASPHRAPVHSAIYADNIEWHCNAGAVVLLTWVQLTRTEISMKNALHIPDSSKRQVLFAFDNELHSY